MVAIDDKFREFNIFQTTFYTDVIKFNEFTNFDFKRHGFVLLSNLGKGFPNLADLYINVKGFNWKGSESPAIMKALQKKFINNFSNKGIPQFIYFSQSKVDKEKTKVKKTENGLIFDIEIQREVCSIMRIDSKTYDYLKFTEDIQYLGSQLAGEFAQSTKTKKVRKKKEITI